MKLSLNKGFDGGGRIALEGPIDHFGIHSTCEVNFRLQLFASCCLPIKIFVHANTLSMLLTEMLLDFTGFLYFPIPHPVLSSESREGIFISWIVVQRKSSF